MPSVVSREDVGSNKYIFLATAPITTGLARKPLLTSESLKACHKGRILSLPHTYRSNTCGKGSTLSRAGRISIHLSGASLSSFLQVSKITSPDSHLIFFLTSSDRIMRLTAGGHTSLKKSRETERGEEDEGQGAPAVGPDRRAGRGVVGRKVRCLYHGQG